MGEPFFWRKYHKIFTLRTTKFHFPKIYFDTKWTLFICLTTLNRVKLGRAVTFMKHLVSVVSLIFLPEYGRQFGIKSIWMKT